MFIKRKEEIHAKLDEAVKNMFGRDITSKKEQESIRDEVNKYFYFRNNALEAALNILKDNTKKSKELRDIWENHLNTKGSEGIRLLSEVIKDKKSTLFTIVISDAISQETIFYLKLANMLLPDVMKGDLVGYHEQFEKEKQSLLGKWDKLFSDCKGINNSIEEISKNLFSIYNNSLTKVKSGYITLREWITIQCKALQIIDDAAPSPPSVFEPINLLIETLNLFMVSHADLSYRFDQLYKSEESVAIIMFGNTRSSVKEFLTNTNLDKAIKNYNEAEKHAKDSAKNMLTNGQQEDALLFVTEGGKITKLTLKAFADVYNSFVDAFKEIFIGPVGDRTVNDLINKERWDWAKNEWQTFNIQSELKKIYDDNKEWLNIDMFNLKPEVKEKIKNIMDKERERLRLAVNQVGDNSIYETIKLFMTVSKQNMFSKLKNF